MIFTHKDIINLLQIIEKDYLHGNICATFEIPRSYLENMPENQQWYIRNGIGMLIQEGYLDRQCSGTIDIPFTCRLTQYGIDVIKNGR